MHVAGTTPYPWPFDGRFSGPGTALLVIAPHESAWPPPQLVKSVGSLAVTLHRLGGSVICAVTQAPARRSRSCGAARESTAALLLDGHVPDHSVRAAGIDAFYGSDLDIILRRAGIERLLLVGCGLETSVHSTMRDANDRGYECLLVVDATRAVDPALVPAAVSMIEMSGGIFGAVGRTAAVLEALEVTPLARVGGAPAAAPELKEI